MLLMLGMKLLLLRTGGGTRLLGWIPEHEKCGPEARRYGNRDKYSAPANTFRTANGEWVHLQTYTDRQFAKLAQGKGRPELAEDPEYASAPAWLRKVCAIEEIVAEWMLRQSVEAALQTLEVADVPHAHVATIRDVLADPQVQRCGYVSQVRHPNGDDVRVQGLPIRLSATPGRSQGAPVPSIGQHTSDVLQEWLRMEEQDVAALREKQVV